MVLFVIELIVVCLAGLTMAVLDVLGEHGKGPFANNKKTRVKHEEKDDIVVFPTHNAKETKKKHSGKCDGDCANCPPHYGYRYGRWYYGRHHIEGCEFGGNDGSGGIN